MEWNGEEKLHCIFFQDMSKAMYELFNPNLSNPFLLLNNWSPRGSLLADSTGFFSEKFVLQLSL